MILNQTYAILEDTSLTITAADGLLRGSSDADDDTLTIVNTTAPLMGSLSVSSDGSFTYVPNPDAYGREWFVYWVTDGTVAVRATATINIGGLGAWGA